MEKNFNLWQHILATKTREEDINEMKSNPEKTKQNKNNWSTRVGAHLVVV